MQCPKCKIEELRKSEHNSAYFCKKCQGMWLLDVELPDYSEISSEDHSAQATSSDNDQVTGICPSGHGIMIRAKVDLAEPFYLEKCITCGGIWFDKGEAQRIDGSIFLENLSELWSRAWQHKQRKEKSRQSFLEINQRLLGDDAFQAVMGLALQLRDHPERSRAMALLQQELVGDEGH